MSLTTERSEWAGSDGIAGSGIAGLDDVMRGGFARNRLYLIEGEPGSGKTTLAMQFLLEGAQRGEPVLYVTLSETAAELRAVADSHGWDLSGVHLHELVPGEEGLDGDDQYTVFHPAEVELGQTTEMILSEVERLRPLRVVFDSVSEIRLLAATPLRYRRQILALKRYFAVRSCTVLLLDDLTGRDRDLQVQSIAHGVIQLDQQSPDYGTERRRLTVLKYRGTAYRGGLHDYVIRRGGIQVFPRLVAAEFRGVAGGARLPSGIAELDQLLGGGLELGTSTLMLGAPGTGKSSIAAQFVATAAANGSFAVMFAFDESIQTLTERARSFGSELESHVAAGRVSLQPVDPAELSPGEFIHRIRVAVEGHDARVVVIDSLNGYLNAMPTERFLIIQLHELLSYLGQRGVATVITAAHRGLIGSHMESPVDATYLADTAVLLRYFEAGGRVRQAISILKKRGGAHERTIRELRLESGRIAVGEPLTRFHGILTGVPVYEGEESRLMENGSLDEP